MLLLAVLLFTRDLIGVWFGARPDPTLKATVLPRRKDEVNVYITAVWSQQIGDGQLVFYSTISLNNHKKDLTQNLQTHTDLD